MGRPKKSTVEILDGIVESLTNLGYDDLARKVGDLRHDVIREAVFSTTSDVYFVDVNNGTAIKVSNDKSKFSKLKVEAPETYEFYKKKMLEFLSAFTDDSMFVKMYGRHGEKLFLEEQNEG